MEREIVVRGTGEARALPDLASLRVEVTADRTSQDEAHQAWAELAATVDEVLARHADAVARTTLTSVWVQPRTRWHRGEDIRTGWRASRTTLVDVAVLDSLGALMSEVVEAGGSVDGPQWSMADTNPAFDLARRAAAADARRRADAYADALGLVLGPVAWVSEPGMRSTGGPWPAEPAARLAAPAAPDTPAEPPDMGGNLTPSEMIVEVSIEVGFGIA